MPQHNTIDSLSRTLSLIKLMARENGATVTEISKETGIDRWTVRAMVDRLDEFTPDGKALFVQEIPNNLDKRETRYFIPKDNLWTLTIPGIELTDEESLLLSLLFAQANASPMLKESSARLKKKLSMFKNYQDYEIMNVSSAKKISTKLTQQIMLSILKSIADKKCINISYKPVRREIKEYLLMPLCVFKYDAGYYLSAQKLPDGEYRTFGLERIKDMPVVIDYDGILPKKVSYEDTFNDPFGPFGHGPEFEAVLKFDSFNGFYNLEKNWSNLVKIETLADESVLMSVKTHSLTGIKKWVLSFGSGVEVISPDWFKDDIRQEHLKAAGVVEKG